MLFIFMDISAPEAERALDVSAASFAVFYDQALPRVYSYFIHRCGGSAAVAEDLTQETFLAAVVELKRGKRIRRPIAWVYGIARHKLLDHYRRGQRGELQMELAWESDDNAQDLVAADQAEARGRAVAALGAVAPSQRAALVLCYLDGYSVAEAARLLGKSTEAVESLLARGRQSFKRAYLEEAA